MKLTGDFTLPGEAGYEELTLKLAKKWGADVIRDSDGTVLSKEIVDSGYDIYSTVCVIRDHNEWLKEHPDCYQESFLMSKPVMAEGYMLTIHLLDGYFDEQFSLNSSDDSLKYWEVFDRTTNEKIDKDKWIYDRETGNVTIQKVTPYHFYTVNFLAFQIWEQISMYNHVTNNWDKEHLAPLDPRNKEAEEYLINWMEEWCKNHPNTDVVRFTSMFYNFAWIWSDDPENRYWFSDWASYDFSVSPKALDDFEKEYGYALTSEDFINQGKLHVTHMPATKRQLDYMEFTQKYVSTLGRKLVDIVHRYKKKAYVFYDDSWIGVEPYGKYYKNFNFDGLIKCVFSGYEARLCMGADTPVHELRLHPYLFPVGLGGLPTFSEGGDPALDTKKYWVNVRRALMRDCVDRLGLGGYLHLTEGYPDYVDYMEELLDEFRQIKALQKDDKAYTLPINVAVLHSWGKLRSWSLSGHFHETYMHTLIHVNEALSGLPVNVEFINFDDVERNDLSKFNVIINAGKAGSAWSGADNWKNAKVVSKLNEWVAKGGTFIGVCEPSATAGNSHYFAMADVLGVDKDLGERVCHSKPVFKINNVLREDIIPQGLETKKQDGVYLTSKSAMVLDAGGNTPTVVINPFLKGQGIYLSDFTYSGASARMLLKLMLLSVNAKNKDNFVSNNPDVDVAFYPKHKKLVAVNNTDHEATAEIMTDSGIVGVSIKPFGMKILEV